MVFQHLTKQSPIVDFLSTHHVARFGQMNANLMRPTRLQPAFNHRVTVEAFYRLNVRNRSFTYVGQPGAAAKAISTIPNQIRFERRFTHLSWAIAR